MICRSISKFLKSLNQISQKYFGGKKQLLMLDYCLLLLMLLLMLLLCASCAALAEEGVMLRDVMKAAVLFSIMISFQSYRR